MPADNAIARVRRHLTGLGAEALTLVKDSYFQRRLATRLRARSAASVDAYADLLDRDPTERGRLRAALSIGVTTFFRNQPSWRRLRQALVARGRQSLIAWSAGAASGEEAYSLGLLLADLGPKLVPDWLIDATDLDERHIETGKQGRYPARVLGDIQTFLPGFSAEIVGGSFEIPPSIRSRVRFQIGDIGAHRSDGSYDLILCRNVLIYFGDAGQARILDGVARALRVGGLLMLGKAETITLDSSDARFETVDRSERIYRRIG